MDKEVLYRFFEGNCSEEEIHAIRTWVESSRENEKDFFRESKLYDSLLLTHTPVSSDIPPKRAVRVNLLRELIKIAAVIIFFISGLSLYNLFMSTHDLSLSTINVPIGKNVNIILPDGSSVWLNARTKFQYATTFNGKKREVFLDGEGYFDVKPDKKRPFIVKTEKYDLEVLGTSFNVEAYSGNEKFVTSLLEGSVKITSLDQPLHSVILKPDEAASLENGELITKNIQNYDIFRWCEGLICFDDTPFTDVMKEFEKHFEIEIHIENERVNKYLCTGKFRQIDGVEYALRILQRDAEFTFERENGTNIIYIK